MSDPSEASVLQSQTVDMSEMALAFSPLEQDLIPKDQYQKDWILLVSHPEPRILEQYH